MGRGVPRRRDHLPRPRGGVRLHRLGGRLPGWLAAAVERGDLADPAGTTVDVGRARAAGTFTPDWVVAHILHEVAAHTGQLQVTRDVLAPRGSSQ